MIRPSSSLWRVMLMVLGIIVCAVAMMWLLTSWVLGRSLGGISRAVILDDLGEYAVLYEKGGIDRIRKLYEAGSHEHDHMLRVMTSSGQLLLEVVSPEVGKVDWPQLPVLPAGKIEWHSINLPHDHGTLLIGRRGFDDGVQLWFGRTDVEDMEILRSVRQQLLLVALVTALVAALPVMWFARLVLGPVRSFIISARALTAGDHLKERLQVKEGIPEIREFAATLNVSLDRVQSLTEELEAANDQLAHELRTPLARIRGNIDAVLANYGEPIGREAAAQGIEEVERSTALIQSILSVRAGDARSMRLHLEALSLKEILTDICELFTAAAEVRGLELELLITGDATVLVDRQRVQQALSNLLDNALAYTPSGGLITVLLDVEPDCATIHVQDTGPGISESDPQRIWRRFMRGTAASASAPGIGLGLSLVRAVAHVHRGEAGAQNRPEGGADFWIKLPTGLASESAESSAQS